ncbi:GMC family oxidoreductase [Spirillospora sp. NPDC052242]
MSVDLTEAQRRTLAALADTWVAAVPPPGVEDVDGFWGRTGTDVGTHRAAEFAITQALGPEAAAGIVELLDALTGVGLADAPPEKREPVIAGVAAAAPEAALGVAALRAMTVGLAYTLVDESGTNPFWSTIGYPAPGTAPALPHQIHPAVPPPTGEVRADAVVIGSGAGGAVIAAGLAAAGRSVVILEAGGYFDGDNAIQHEIEAGPNVYYRGGGSHTTAEGNVSLWAGATLGGGTTVNLSNCVRPPAALRAVWAERHGLSDVDGPEFDAHIDAVLARLGANEEASVYNGPHRKMVAGAQALGWRYRRALLNLDPRLIEADRGSLLTYGDRTGAKQSTVRTFLLDAATQGAQVFIRTRADRIRVEDGRATGVSATALGPDGTPTALTVHAANVVVACGALETPALLQRSGIGGPAVGRHLHLHPVILASGRYADALEPWTGPPQAAMVDEFAADIDADRTGFLIESVASQVGATAATLPWVNAADHKARMAKMRNVSALVAIIGDKSEGTVTLDDRGQAVHEFPLAEQADRTALYRALEMVARLHEAAGAEEIYPLTPGVPARTWRRGDDLAEVLAEWKAIPLGLGGHVLSSAHQMGSARLGTDPADSVAKPSGELHDTAGVWIGDTSAFPSALGVNPMITCMALARRTAGHILG